MPDLEQCAQAALSEQSRDFIVGRTEGFWKGFLGSGACRQELEYSLQVLYLGEEELGVPLHECPYSSIPRCYTLLDVQALGQAGISPAQGVPGLSLSGAGTILGFIDTGIRYQDPAFRNLDGSTRILRIWDQTEQTGTPPEGFLYGSEYTGEQINTALRSERPEEMVPSQDRDGHGTVIASVACGGGNVENGFLGVAPEAALAVVKLKEAKKYLREYYYVKEGATCYQENDIMAALCYLHRVARKEGRPMVICMALGSSLGGHSGATPLSAYMEVLSNIPLLSLVAAAGNEADKRHHYLGSIRDEIGEEIEIQVGEGTEGFVTELWTELPNIYSVSVTSPTGESTGRIPVRDRSDIHDFLLEQTRVYVNYHLLVESAGSEMIFLRFARPLAGIWRVRVEPLRLEDGLFHAWLPMEEFLTAPVYFLRSTPDNTVTDPGNTRSAATVGFYNGNDNSVAVGSGRGYTRSNGIKPDFVAPGVNVTAVDLRGRYTTHSGSSIAAALGAGAESLLMEWLLEQNLYPDSVMLKNLLILGAMRIGDRTYPNREWGYGAMNLYQTFDMVRRF